MVLCSMCQSANGVYLINSSISICNGPCKNLLGCISCGCRLWIPRLLCKDCEAEVLVTNYRKLEECSNVAIDFLYAHKIKFTKNMLRIQKYRNNPINDIYKSATENASFPLGFCCSYQDSFDNEQQLRFVKNTEIKSVTTKAANNYAIMKLLNILFFDDIVIKVANNLSSGLVYRLGCMQSTRKDIFGNPYIKGINVIKNLPKHRTIGTLIHEYIHAWIFLCRAKFNLLHLDEKFVGDTIESMNEEAICTYASMLYWQDMCANYTGYTRQLLRIWLYNSYNNSKLKNYIIKIEEAIKETSYIQVLANITFTGYIEV